MRLGFIYGILAAVSIVIPLLLIDHLAMIKNCSTALQQISFHIIIKII
jgi:hypothetical protein